MLPRGITRRLHSDSGITSGRFGSSSTSGNFCECNGRSAVICGNACARARGKLPPAPARAPTGDLRTTVVVDSAGDCGLRDGCHRNKSTSGLSGCRISTF